VLASRWTHACALRASGACFCMYLVAWSRARSLLAGFVMVAFSSLLFEFPRAQEWGASGAPFWLRAPSLQALQVGRVAPRQLAVPVDPTVPL
jgi:hypothetical protein